MQSTGPSPLIAASELSDLLADRVAVGGCTVLDVRYRMGGPSGLEEYLRGHVPGAAYVDLDVALASAPGQGGRHPLPAPDVLESALRAVGVRDDLPVVVYDDWAGRAAARCWWLLRWAGHQHVRVLDGGWSAWVASGGTQSRERVSPAQGDFAVRPGHLAVVLAEGVLDLAEQGVLVDAREPQRFRGEVEPVDPVAGHIPGAVNVPTSANLAEDGRFRPVAELREAYAVARAGAARGEPVGAYCGSGVTAAHDILALAVVGIEATLYPGSWSEWVYDPARPVATGG